MIRLKYLQFTLLLLLYLTCNACGKACYPEDLTKEICGEGEGCMIKDEQSNIGECECTAGYKRLSEGGQCVKNSTNVEETNTSHVVASVLIPLFLVLLVIITVYYSRKYRLISWLRYKVNQRYNSNYDDVMIGQDDD